MSPAASGGIWPWRRIPGSAARHVRVLADVAERAEDIDAARARLALQRAQEQIGGYDPARRAGGHGTRAIADCGGGTEIMSWFTVRVPASSANLGPGFDSLGLALGVYLTCRFRGATLSPSAWRGAMPRAFRRVRDNLIWQTAVTVARSRGAKCRPSSCTSKTTSRWARDGVERGGAHHRGSIIADQLLDLGWKPLRILDEAARLEGHPDNVAPARWGRLWPAPSIPAA